MDLKQSLELMEGLKVLGVAAKKIGADGKINIADLPAFLELMNKSNHIIAAAQGVEAIPAEMKDLSQEEAALLLAKVYEVLSAIKAA